MNAEVSTQEQPQEVEAVKPAETPQEEVKQDGQQDQQRKPVQPRIDELTRARREAERERDYWRQQAIGKQAQESAPQPPAKPTPETFKTYDEYVEALADWKADQKIDARLKDRDERDSKRAAENSRQAAWRERANAAIKEIPDLDATLAASDVVMSQAMIDTLYESEMGPKVAYHLAKNPDVAARIANLPPNAAAREIGHIEAEIKRAAVPSQETEEEIETPPPLKKTKAPAPPSPVGQGRSTQPKLADMGMEDYIATRAKQGARWAGR